METPVSICSTPGTSKTLAQGSNTSGKQPMSTTLRERLKKARRSFNATCTVAKRLKINEETCSTYEGSVLSTEKSHSALQDEGKHLEKNSDETLCLKNALPETDLCETGCSKTLQNSPQVLLLGTECRQWELLEEKTKLVKQIQEKEELLRRLKLVKMYRSKNNPVELQSLIAKWRSSSQAMLYELQSTLSTDGKKLSLTELIDNFGLDDQLLHYMRTEEDFTDT
ncbi:swi5-dependent recombination DNA repair protein 1 homolog [Tiliqua scincoides]|uniref:swi5-dependent recombination DNA repair protein 1 homolog n=1 Tax=Tiliqua scincoides TaxID=71010 RepID=UPI003461902E